MELRNRFYWGDDVRVIPQFEKQLRNKAEAADLSNSWINTRTSVFHSNIERLFLEWRRSKWNARAGRQRINWGTTNIWNPNDLFNTYNFLDFDYEERPGADAVKFQYMISDLSNLELAAAKVNSGSIIAGKYFVNYKKYDLHLLAGSYRSSFTAGLGWAGSISDMGFKGELQVYGDRGDSISHIIGTVEADYIFKSGWYLSGAILYNQKGLHAPLQENVPVIINASPRNLMPARWNFLINTSKEFTPRLNGSLNLVYSPQVNLLIFFPTLRYDLRPNLDLDLVCQSAFAQYQRLESISQTIFLRIKWSY
jgi:hypothetical protein